MFYWDELRVSGCLELIGDLPYLHCVTCQLKHEKRKLHELFVYLSEMYTSSLQTHMTLRLLLTLKVYSVHK